MRVIAGEKKGLVLKEIKGSEIRPTLDRVKETLFNIITNEVYLSEFLDIFSGTGQIAIEALSRYASSVYMVENSRASLKVLTDNLKKAKYEDKASVLNKSAIDAIKVLSMNKKSFNIIFADPPYGYKDFECLIKSILDDEILKDDGIFIIEHDKKIDISSYISKNYYIYKERKFATSQLSFIKNTADKE